MARPLRPPLKLSGHIFGGIFFSRTLKKFFFLSSHALGYIYIKPGSLVEPLWVGNVKVFNTFRPNLFYLRVQRLQS